MSAQTVLILTALSTVSPNLSLAKALAYASAVDAALPVVPESRVFDWKAASIAERAREVEKSVPQVIQSLRDGKKIQAIKDLRSHVGAFVLDLKAAKDVIDSLSPAYFVSATYACCGGAKPSHVWNCWNRPGY